MNARLAELRYAQWKQMLHARSCRAVLDRIGDTDHNRRRATVATMQDHVTKARQLNRTIVRIKQETQPR